MGIFDKLFGNRSIVTDPDNAKLLNLIDKYLEENGEGDTYKNVVMELMNGNSFLILPSQNENRDKSGKWIISKKEKTLTLASIVNVDGLKVLGVFTDEKAMLNWTKKPCEYTAMRSEDVLKLADANGIDRIVINSDQPNMFVLQKKQEKFETYTVQEATKVLVGTPNKPLSKSIIQNLIGNIKENNVIEEVYQYGQTKNGEFSIVLAFKLTDNSEDAKTSVINLVQKALENEKPDQLLDLFFIEKDNWYDTIKHIENSLLYKC